MKNRKLILKSKLQQIEKQYQYVFIYHCSGLTNHEWRKLKDLLSNNDAKAFFQPTFRKVVALEQICKSPTDTFSCGALSDEPVIPCSRRDRLDLVNYKLSQLSGPFCIFYLKSPNKTDNFQNKANWPEIVKKIESLEYKTKLILLYARINSTIVNHVDIKHALYLETRELYQQLLWSIQSPVFNLGKILHQKKCSLPSILDKQESSYITA